MVFNLVVFQPTYGVITLLHPLLQHYYVVAAVALGSYLPSRPSYTNIHTYISITDLFCYICFISYFHDNSRAVI